MPFIAARDGSRIYVKSWGDGRPVVLIHGWPLSADSWDYQAMALAKAGFRAVAYDRRGFGRSDQPWSGYDYDVLSDDLAEVIEQCGLSDVTLAGFSMGGGEVARYMARHDGRKVRKAALVGSIVPYMPQTADNLHGVPRAVFDEMTMGIMKDRPAFLASFFKQFYGVGLVSSPVSREVLDWSWAIAMQAGLHPTLQCANAFATTDFRGDLAAFNVPTLIVHGTADAIVPIDATSRAAHRAIPGSTLVEVDGGPHGLLASHATHIADELLKFVRA